MADYRDIFNGTFGKVVGRVKDAAGSSGVAEVYAQGAGRARAFGQVARLSLAINGENEELKRVYAEIGRLCFEEAKDAPAGVFAPLFEQAQKLTDGIRDKQAQIDTLRARYAAQTGGESDIDVEIGDFDDIVSATEADGMTVEIRSDKPEQADDAEE